MFGLQIVDLVVIVVHFLAMIAIGFWAMRRIKNQEDYFLGGRRFGKVLQIFASFGQGTSTDSAVSVSTTTFNNGLSGIWVSMLGLFTTPIYWITSPWYRRLRLITLGDFFEERYNSKTLGGVYAVLGSIFLMAALALGFMAMTKTVAAMTPKDMDQLTAVELTEYEHAVEMTELESRDVTTLTVAERTRLDELRLEQPRKVFSHIDEDTLIWIVSLIVLVYAVAGGLEAAFYTDMIQGNFIILLSIVFIPFGINRINEMYGSDGLSGAIGVMQARLPESFFEVFGSPNAIDFTWYYIAAVALMATVNVAVQPNQMTISAAAKDEFSARVGFTTGFYLKRLCTILWGVFGLLAVVLYAGSIENSDYVWGTATRDLLGPLGIGLVGLMIACLMAALMSTADAFMIVSSSLLTHNVFRVAFPNASERTYVIVGRVCGALVILGGVLIATWFDGILQILKFAWEYNIMLAAGFWLGMKWRRANRPAVWTSILLTMLVFFVIPISLPIAFPSLRTSEYLLKTTDPQPVSRQYRAHAMDVEQRKQAIAAWDALAAEGGADGARPEPLAEGEVFEKLYPQPKKSIFWTHGLKKRSSGTRVYDDASSESSSQDEAVKYGAGALNIDLVLIDLAGFDLAENPYALNETIRVMSRITFPFAVLLVVGYLTRPEDEPLLARFYGKMRTPVLADPEADRAEMEKTLADPHRFDDQKLFPRSSWEINRWNRVDGIGFIIALAVMFGILGLLYLLSLLG